MKLQLGIVAFLAALVSQTLAQLNPSMLLRLVSPDIKLPPKPPASLFPQLYRAPGARPDLGRRELAAKRPDPRARPDPQAAQRQLAAKRQQQEQELYSRLKGMTPEDVKVFQAKLSPTQLQQLVARIKVLKHREATGATATPGTPDGPNMILSGANTVRRPTASARAAAIAALRRRMAARRPTNPLQAVSKYQSYRKKAMSAVAAGCTYPIGMETMSSFFAFGSGGCRRGGAVSCAMAGRSCVDVGMSIMCCPPGYTSGTLDAIRYMKQMQSFMAQFS